eukprot:SAG31_NODE_2343_length_5906_cov_2.399346_2_plen_139_part_00
MFGVEWDGDLVRGIDTTAELPPTPLEGWGDQYDDALSLPHVDKLTAADLERLEKLNPQSVKQFLGELLFDTLSRDGWDSAHAGGITGEILQLDRTVVVSLLKSEKQRGEKAHQIVFKQTTPTHGQASSWQPKFRSLAR